MALFHRATIAPTKEQLIARWAPTQPWGPPAGEPLEVIGSYRFDDPDGRVGMESFLVSGGGVIFHVPLTYRDTPLEGADGALITEMQHSVLGARWVYDGLSDPLSVAMLAAVAMTGQGEALGMAVYDGRWYVAPSAVRVQGGGWTQERVPVDRFERASPPRSPSQTTDADADRVVFTNDRFELVVWRRPTHRPRPAMGLAASWEGASNPVVLAQVREL